MKRIVMIAIAMSVLPAVAVAQADGTWVGETEGRGGVQEVTLTLDGSGGTWVQGPQETVVSEVTANGNEVSFQREMNFGGRGARVLTYNGVIDGDQITLTVSFGGRGDGGPRGGAGPGRGGREGRGAPMPIVLTRQ